MEYQPLNAERDEIRLLTLYSSQNPAPGASDVVCCTLENVSLEHTLNPNYNLKSRLEAWTPYWDEYVLKLGPSRKAKKAWQGRYSWGDYVALSYRWSDPNNTREIFINRKPVHVTENLECALRVLRNKLPMRIGVRLWVDAICINQQDLEERNLQVERMQDIYKKAFEVVVWLGNETDDTWKAMLLIKTLSLSWQMDGGEELKTLLKGNPNYSVASYRNPGAQSIFGYWHALHSLMKRDYWNRVWIIQELSMGTRETPILCGHCVIYLGDLYDALLDFHNGHNDPSIMSLEEALMIREQLPELDLVEGSILDLVGKYPHKDVVINSGTLNMVRMLQRLLAEGRWPHPENLLPDGRRFSATDPRDKVYGFMGLVDPFFAQGLKPDYKLSVERVYTDFSIAFMQADQRLDLISHCNWTSDQTAPSWVPDWNNPNIDSFVIEPSRKLDDPFCAGGEARSHGIMRISPDQKRLRVLCLKIDTIDGLSMNPFADESDTLPTQPTTSNNAYGDMEGFRDALWRTFLCNRNLDGTIPQPDNGNFRALLDIPLPQENGHLNTAMEEIFYTFIISNRDLLLVGQPLDHYFKHKGLHCKIDIEGRIMQKFLEKPLVKGGYSVAKKRLFTTHKGLVGLAPLSSQPGDLLCVLVACKLPLILRFHGASFKVIGPCYAHGVMEGEAMDGKIKCEEIYLC